MNKIETCSILLKKEIFKKKKKERRDFVSIEAPMASPMITNRTPISCSLLFGASFPSPPPSSLQTPARAQKRMASGLRIRAETMATEKLGIKVERNLPESKLAELGVRQWPK